MAGDIIPAMQHKTTPLLALHRAFGAHLDVFAGYIMPIYYRGIIEEHQWTRTHVSLFDTAHMGMINVQAPSAMIQHCFTNDLSSLKTGRCRYGFFVNAAGEVIDDTIAYRRADDQIMFVINAGHDDVDMSHVRAAVGLHWQTEVLRGYAKTDVQGPESRDVLRAVFGAGIDALRYFSFATFRYEEREIIISCTGYTGELGYEIYLPQHLLVTLWERLLKDERVRPAGLGARDSLRLEMGYALYGHEIGNGQTVFEAGLGQFVKPEIDCFGAAALRAQKDTTTKRLIYFVCEGKRVARAGYDVMQNGTKIGAVCSGAYSPGREKAIGNAFVESASIDMTAPLSLVNERGAVIIAAIAASALIADTSLLT